VVVASDQMVTASFLALEFEHPGGKIEKISKTCVGLTAGDALAHTELFRACRGKIKVLQSPSMELIAQHVKEQFVELRSKRAEDFFLKPRGMTLSAFYQDGIMKQLPTELAMGLDNNIQNARFPLEIILAGVDESGAHIYGVNDPGVTNCYDRLFYHAIGSGAGHALLHIIGNNHHEGASIRETLYIVYEAKKKAELAQGVGAATEIGFVARAGIRILSDGEQNLLEDIYIKRMTPQLNEVQELITGLPFERCEGSSDGDKEQAA